MSAAEWLGLIVLYVAGSALCMAAFAKAHKMSGERVTGDEKSGAIVGSICAWPICLVICIGLIVYRKVYDD